MRAAESPESVKATEKALVLDFGSQYSNLIVRRCRELGVYAALLPGDAELNRIRHFKPVVVILSGGPSSVYEVGAPHLSSGVLEYFMKERIPTLGICYGLQELIHILEGDGAVEAATAREYGSALLSPIATGRKNEEADDFFEGISQPTTVWMSHGDKVTRLPNGFRCIAVTTNSEFCAVSSAKHQIWGVQFHPEVSHTVEGRRMLSNFLFRCAKLQGNWSIERYVEIEVQRLKDRVGTRHVLGAVSGGIDSTVSAALMHRAVGNRFHAFLIDTGLMRLNEPSEAVEALKSCIPGISIKCIDAADHFYNALKGVIDPEEKRRAIGKLFVDQFEKASAEIKVDLSNKKMGLKENLLLLQGTLYPDVIESMNIGGPSRTIKTHHNVGGLPEKMNLEVIEPLRHLFKDEVRHMGEVLGLPKKVVWRHPFPGPGLGIRIVGEVTRERVATLQKADSIFMNELQKAGVYYNIGQALSVLLPGAKSVGVMGDQRTYEASVALRAVTTTDYMTADWYPMEPSLLTRIATRIVNEVRGVNRVVYDVTSKPPGTIEWE